MTVGGSRIETGSHFPHEACTESKLSQLVRLRYIIPVEVTPSKADAPAAAVKGKRKNGNV